MIEEELINRQSLQEGYAMNNTNFMVGQEVVLKIITGSNA